MGTLDVDFKLPRYAVRLADETIEDYTVWSDEWNPGPALGLLNADIPADGTKYYVHLLSKQLIGGNSFQWTLQYDYISSEPTEQSIVVNQFDVNKDFRPFTNCADWGTFPNADDPRAHTDPTDTGLLDLLDSAFSTTPFTLHFVILGRTGQLNGDRMVLWSPEDFVVGTNYGGLGSQLVFNGGNNALTFAQNGNAGPTNSANAITWNKPQWGQNKYMHVVLASDGNGTWPSNAPDFYINRQKALPSELSGLVNPLTGGIRPQDGRYYHGYWSGAFGDTNKQPARTAMLQVFDKKLSGEEVSELFNDPFAGRTGAISKPVQRL